MEGERQPRRLAAPPPSAREMDREGDWKSNWRREKATAPERRSRREGPDGSAPGRRGAGWMRRRRYLVAHGREAEDGGVGGIRIREANIERCRGVGLDIRWPDFCTSDL